MKISTSSYNNKIGTKENKDKYTHYQTPTLLLLSPSPLRACRNKPNLNGRKGKERKGKERIGTYNIRLEKIKIPLNVIINSILL
jgi:hypothetical protein